MLFICKKNRAKAYKDQWSPTVSAVLSIPHPLLRFAPASARLQPALKPEVKAPTWRPAMLPVPAANIKASGRSLSMPIPANPFDPPEWSTVVHRSKSKGRKGGGVSVRLGEWNLRTHVGLVESLQPGSNTRPCLNTTRFDVFQSPVGGVGYGTRKKKLVGRNMNRLDYHGQPTRMKFASDCQCS